MAKTIAELEIGTLVKDSGTIYNGVPIVFRIADKNHGGYPENSVTLMTEKIISVKCFDAKEPRESDSDRKFFGNNRYAHSNIRQWLNNNLCAGEWYTPQHQYDEPPTDEGITNGVNGFDTESGFLTNFSGGMLNALMDTTLNVVKASIDGGGSETVTDKVFLASITELGKGNEISAFPEGIKFNNNYLQIKAYPTEGCVNQSEFKNPGIAPNVYLRYYTRTPASLSSCSVRAIDPTGELKAQVVATTVVGIRPLINLPAATKVSDLPSAGVYTLMFDAAPTPPTDITVPETVNGGTNVEIIWGAATDADNDLTGYILERQHDEVVWEQIYKGANQNFKDTINIGWESVAYRVKAYDATDAESDYTTSETRSVINNTIPIISGDDENLGVKTGAFEYKYTITDGSRGQIITVTEEIDGKEKRNYTAVSGVENYLEVTNAEWLEILNGVHTLKITAENELGKAVRILTCSKNEKEIELTLSASLVTDDMLTKGNISVMGEIPEGAELSVKVCNNAKDEIPTWEDVTNAVIGGKNFCVDNITKTSENWSFNLKIKLNRKNAVGDCYIDLIRGNFE